ncbi:hypothetical protein BC833DRAFT_93803 [Globomyces pollinis-pini]|nr:hypothetical protein BC833DRAFT_93803 [Globomyces pollinis-pini]
MKFYTYILTALVVTAANAPLPAQEFAKGSPIGPNGEQLGGEGPVKKYTNLQTISVPRSTLQPRTVIKASYQGVPEDSQDVYVAKLNITTQRPTLNLDNFLQINNLDCATNLLTLTFNSTVTATAAYNEWNVHPDLALYFGHEWSCPNGKVHIHTRSVQGITLKDNVLAIQTAALPMEQVIDEYVIDLYDVENASQLQKRVEHTFKPIPLNVNYDGGSQTVVRPEIALFEKPHIVAGYCVNCHTRGDARLKVQFSVGWKGIKSYRLNVFGQLDANMDLKLSLGSKTEQQLFKTRLFALPFGGVNIPGIFKLGPEFDLDAAVNYRSEAPIDFGYGMDLSYPFNFQMESNDGLFGKPAFSKTGDVVLREHLPSRTKDFELDLSAHLIPGFNFAIGVFSRDIVNLGVQLDSALGIIVSGGQFTICPKDNFNVELYHQHEIGLSLPFESAPRKLYQSGKLRIVCFFCEKCFPRPAKAN